MNGQSGRDGVPHIVFHDVGRSPIIAFILAELHLILY
jgi:hypothetical protein